MKDRVSVTVPASSGNIGPGFDVWGLALELRNELHVRVLDKNPGMPVIRVIGQGKDALPTDKRNVIYQTVVSLFARAKKRVPRLELVCVNRIPLARGLGSSSAAYLAGLVTANRLLGEAFSRQEILNFATELEGHPDNVAPALFGGVRASGVLDGRVVTAALPVPRLKIVVAVPPFELSTKKARAVLPKKIPLEDAVFNLSAVSLLPSALSDHTDWLRFLLNDRLHEPYRAKLIPGFHHVKQAAMRAGAFGVILSGAGPTMLSFSPGSRAVSVAKAMRAAFARAGVRSKTMELEIDKKGVVVR